MPYWNSDLKLISAEPAHNAESTESAHNAKSTEPAHNAEPELTETCSQVSHGRLVRPFSCAVSFHCFIS